VSVRGERDPIGPVSRVALADTPAVVTVSALLSVATVAELLDCSTWTVRRRIDTGELRAYREHGRVVIRGDDLRAYIDALEAVGKTATSRRRPTRRSYASL
jgi:excisionase family DNA binding protein